MLSSAEAAAYLSSKERMTNPRIQKILYFAQGYSLELLGRPLLSDATFQRWDDGPVEPSVYQMFKHKRGSYAPKKECKLPPENWTIDQQDSKKILDSLFSQFSYAASDSELSERAQSHSPWKHHSRNEEYSEEEIKHAVASDPLFHEEATNLLLKLCSFEEYRQEHEENARVCGEDFLEYLKDGWCEELGFRKYGILCPASDVRALEAGL